jgi:hypothetical protein
VASITHMTCYSPGAPGGQTQGLDTVEDSPTQGRYLLCRKGSGPTKGSALIHYLRVVSHLAKG